MKKKEIKRKEKQNTEKKKKYKFNPKIKKMRFSETKYPADSLLIIFIVGIITIGIVMIFSASSYWALNQTGNPYQYLFDQCLWVLLGGIAMYVASVIDCRKYRELSPIIFAIGIVLLLLLFIPGVGVTVNNATRWIALGPLTIMPGEIAKVTTILFMAHLLSRQEGVVNSMKKGILPVFLSAGLVVGLISIENMSTALTVAGIIVAMLVIAGLNMKYFVMVGGVGIVGAFAMLLSDSGGYRLDRITSFLDPFNDPQGSGYQVVQSLLALGGGGLWGKGLGNSVQKNLYLPEPQNDFIFAIIGEELGFVGAMVIILLYIVIIWRGIKITIETRELYLTLLAGGITAMIAIQVAFNIGVVTSSIPPTGVILPLVSYGGNATLLVMGLLGILLNISRQNNKAIMLEGEKVQ